MTENTTKTGSGATEFQAEIEPRLVLAGVNRWLGILASPIEGKIVLGPNWFASVMGTGIIGIAATILPIQFPGLFAIGSAAWLIASLLLVCFLIVIPLHWWRQPETLRALIDDPVAIQFFGAPPMALMTVGISTLLVGKHYIGVDLALPIALVLWATGSLLGLFSAVLVPYRLFTQLKVEAHSAFGGWLMPVVPPTVTAAGGAQLIPYIPEGVWRESLLMTSYAFFGMSFVVSLLVIAMIWSRLAHHGSSGSARVPTLWIVLGPIGQSITAVGGLGLAAHLAIAEPFATGMKVFGLMIGISLWGFIWLWLPIALLLTLRAYRKNMGFALTWWSFTFPVGTCVTGTCLLAIQTGLPMFRYCSVAMFGFLLLAWLIVLIHTAKGSLHGKLLTPPMQSATPKTSKD